MSKAGYYIDSNVFKKCNASCKECLDSPTNCKICDENFYNLDTDEGKIPFTCYDKNSNFKGFFASNEKKSFVSCDVSCSECNLNSKHCKICKAGYAKKELDLKNNCFPINEAISNLYYNNEENLFKKCDVSCKECINASNKCKICNENYFTKETDKGNTKECYSITKELIGFYFNKNDKVFKLCDQSCKTCQINATSCQECNSNFYKTENDVYNQCVKISIRTDGFYLSEKEKLFKKCDDSCKVCNDESKKCLQCNNSKNYYALEDKKRGIFNFYLFFSF